jgi:hypothetical protein
MKLREILLIILIIGLLLVIINLTKMYTKCPENKIIYKYIPRTFKEEQESPIDVSEIFKELFNKPSPWVGGFTSNENFRELKGDI